MLVKKGAQVSVSLLFFAMHLPAVIRGTYQSAPDTLRNGAGCWWQSGSMVVSVGRIVSRRAAERFSWGLLRRYFIKTCSKRSGFLFLWWSFLQKMHGVKWRSLVWRPVWPQAWGWGLLKLCSLIGIFWVLLNVPVGYKPRVYLTSVALV